VCQKLDDDEHLCDVVASARKASQTAQEQHQVLLLSSHRAKHHTSSSSPSSSGTIARNPPVNWLLGHCDDGIVIMLVSVDVLGHNARQSPSL
jgi:hypothetical protein